MKYDKEILNKIYEKQKKQKNGYIRPGSNGYMFFKVMVIISFAVNAFISIFSDLSYFLRNFVALTAGSGDAELLKTIKQNLIYITAFLLIFIASFVLILCKKYIAGLITSSISSIGLMISFAKILSNHLEVYGYLYYILKHLGPLTVYLIFTVLICIFGIRANIKTKKEYLAFTDKDYKKQF